MDNDQICIIFSTADWHAPYWTNKQHTAIEMAKRGIQVLYIETIGLRQPKMTSGKDLQRILKRIKNCFKGTIQIRKNIWLFSPIAIPFGHHHSWIRRFNQKMLRIGLKSFLDRRKFSKPIIWTYHPYMLESIAGLITGPLVYHCVDDLSAVPGINGKAFIREERLLLHRADVVFTTSMSLFEKCSEYNTNVHDYPNVVDFDHFARAFADEPIPADLASIPEPRIGYIGALSDYKVDFNLLNSVAQTHKEWHFVLIGEEREGQNSTAIKDIRSLSNVHFMGYRRYHSLPSYLKGLNVGLLPTCINEYTRSMFPMKYYEYLAAGVPVVSTPLAFTKEHCAPALIVAHDHFSYSEAIQKQLLRGRLTLQESQSAIGDNTWKVRLDKMIEKVMAL